MLTKAELEQIVRQTVMEVAGAGSRDCWLCDTVDEAVEAAASGQKRLVELGLEERDRMIAAMRETGNKNARYLAELAHNETGYGSVAHKLLKNQLAANKTPGIEDLTTKAYSGDDGLTIVESAPWGVIGSITPSTNPTSTIINNTISMIAAGNAVVFNPHPAAKHASQEAMRLMNEAIASAGGPGSLITTVKEPTLETGNAIMGSRRIPLLSITGGEAVVAAAMKYPKRVIAAGPGNPPVIVDDSVNIPHAARMITDGASFDNNVLCVAEKEVFAFENIADALMDEMVKAGAFRVRGGDIDKVTRTVLVERDGKYSPNKKYVGRDAAFILRESGVSCQGNPRLVIAEVEKTHPFITTEMLMPVLGIARVRDINEAIDEAVRAENGCLHSAIMHSQLIGNMTLAATALNTSIFVKNAPSYSGLGFGGQGFTTLTIATPTGEGLTSARTFTRARRCVLKGDLRII